MNKNKKTRRRACVRLVAIVATALGCVMFAHAASAESSTVNQNMTLVVEGLLGLLILGIGIYVHTVDKSLDKKADSVKVDTMSKELDELKKLTQKLAVEVAKEHPTKEDVREVVAAGNANLLAHLEGLRALVEMQGKALEHLVMQQQDNRGKR